MVENTTVAECGYEAHTYLMRFAQSLRLAGHEISAQRWFDLAGELWEEAEFLEAINER